MSIHVDLCLIGNEISESLINQKNRRYIFIIEDNFQKSKINHKLRGQSPICDCPSIILDYLKTSRPSAPTESSVFVRELISSSFL